MLALGSFHIQLCVWSGGVVATEKGSCHLSGRLLLFAEKKERRSRGGYLLLANTAYPQWWSTQLPLWPDSWLSSECCRDFSLCKLLLNVIQALHVHRALVEPQNKDSPSSTAFGHQNENSFPRPLLIDVNCYKWSLFSLFCQCFFEVAVIPFSFPPSTEQLLCTWSTDVSRPTGHPE